MNPYATANYGLIQLVIVLCSIGLGVFAGGWFVGLRIQQKIKTGALIRVEDHDNTVRQIVSTLKFGHNVNEVQKDYNKLFHGDAQAQLAADLDASEKAENGPITFRPDNIDLKQEYPVVDYDEIFRNQEGGSNLGPIEIKRPQKYNPTNRS